MFGAELEELLAVIASPELELVTVPVGVGVDVDVELDWVVRVELGLVMVELDRVVVGLELM